MQTQHFPSPAAAPSAAAVRVVDAVVQTGAAETRYRRAGSGPPLLLLRPGGSEDDALLLARLAGSFRVISLSPPSPPQDGGKLAAWLRDVIDGLGLARPLLVVDGPMEDDARRFFASDGVRAGGVFVLPADGGDGEEVLRRLEEDAAERTAAG